MAQSRQRRRHYKTQNDSQQLNTQSNVVSMWVVHEHGSWMTDSYSGRPGFRKDKHRGVENITEVVQTIQVGTGYMFLSKSSANTYPRDWHRHPSLGPCVSDPNGSWECLKVASLTLHEHPRIPLHPCRATGSALLSNA